MNHPKWSPAPWHYQDGEVAELSPSQYSQISEETYQANLRIASVSPELYEALQQCADVLDPVNGKLNSVGRAVALVHALQALAKARGEQEDCA